MSKVLCVVQCRLGSSRLPRKALMDVGGVPMIQRVVWQAKKATLVSRVVVAVPTANDAAWIGTAVGDLADVLSFPDVDETDVLTRYARCAEAFPMVRSFVRVTGDCPLLDPNEIDRVISSAERAKFAHYASNVASGYRDGEDVEWFTRDMLMRAHNKATDAEDREHVTPWMRRQPGRLDVFPLEYRSDVKTSVDTLNDLERVRAMVMV